MANDVFLKVICPNRPKPDKDWLVCKAIAAGPSMEMLERFDYSKGPFYDIRYCERCHCFFTTTIFDLKSPIKYAVKEGQIDFIDADDFFPLTVTEGRKVK